MSAYGIVSCWDGGPTRGFERTPTLSKLQSNEAAYFFHHKQVHKADWFSPTYPVQATEEALNPYYNANPLGMNVWHGHLGLLHDMHACTSWTCALCIYPAHQLQCCQYGTFCPITIAHSMRLPQACMHLPGSLRLAAMSLTHVITQSQCTFIENGQIKAEVRNKTGNALQSAWLQPWLLCPSDACIPCK